MQMAEKSCHHIRLPQISLDWTRQFGCPTSVCTLASYHVLSNVVFSCFFWGHRPQCQPRSLPHHFPPALRLADKTRLPDLPEGRADAFSDREALRRQAPGRPSVLVPPHRLVQHHFHLPTYVLCHFILISSIKYRYGCCLLICFPTLLSE